MRSLRSIVAVATLSLSLPVFAVPTPTTTAYDFNAGSTSGTTLSSTGGPISNILNASGCDKNGNGCSYVAGDPTGSYQGLYNGSYFGNSATYTAGGLTTTVTAWASTGGGSSVNASGTVNTTSTNNGTIQNAVLTSYSTNNGTTNMNPAQGMSLAETSRDTTVNQEFTCPGGSGNSCTAYAPNHAVDNSGAYETLLFSFSSAVTLSTVTLGYPSVDTGTTAGTNNNDLTSDMTILYCKTTAALCATSTFANKTFYQLVSSGNWGYTDLLNLSATNDTASVGVNANSTLWMVGAYIADLPSQTGNDGNPDYVKIRGLTVCTTGSGASTTGCAVPEPSSIALFGIAAGALCVGRRRRQLRVA